VETLQAQFMTCDSLFLYVLQTQKSRREKFQAALATYTHLQVLHHRTPRATNRWLKTI